MAFPPVFVINLARDTDRAAHMRAALAQIGLAGEFIEAVDGRALTPADRAMVDPARTRLVYGNDLLDNEIGCYLSHYRLYQRMIDENIEVALIMEDDLDISPDLPALVTELLADPDPPWLVVRLDSLRTQLHAPPSRRFAGRAVRHLAHGTLFRLDVHVLGLGAYLIRREAAARMLAHGRRIFMPIDQTMDRFWENGLVPFVVRPFPVRQRADLASRIGARPAGRHRGLSLAWRLRRRLQRVRDSLAKRLFNLRRS
jgi:glycosyl transferase family 25